MKNILALLFAITLLLSNASIAQDKDKVSSTPKEKKECVTKENDDCCKEEKDTKKSCCPSESKSKTHNHNKMKTKSDNK